MSEGITPREKLRRFLRAHGVTLVEADRITDSNPGQTNNMVQGRSERSFTTRYLGRLVDGVPGALVGPDWFLDGRDDYPVQVAAPAHEIPLVGEIPQPNGVPFRTLSTLRKLRVEGFEEQRYFRVAEDLLLPFLRKGDLVLVGTSDRPRHGVLALIRRFDGSFDLYQTLKGPRGGYTLAALTDDQDPPPADHWTQVGIAVSYRRIYAGDMIADVDSPTGLTPEIMSL